MSLKTIRLELARCAEFPEGSARRGYEFMAPVDAEGHIDLAEWRKSRARCAARRFWEAEDDLYGHLIRTEDGQWAFHHDLEAEPGPDELGYRFESHAFRPGEYVSITEHDGVTRTFTVTSIE